MVDEEYTDAEIRALLRKVASERRRDEIRQRLKRAGDLEDKRKDETTTETPDKIPLQESAA